MAGIGLDLTLEMRQLQAFLNRAAQLDTPAMLRVLGTEVESQTRRRITEEQASPDGEPWAAWSTGYAETRKGSGSLLADTSALLNSIANQDLNDGLAVGTNLQYAAIHQFGGLDGMAPGPAGIPERPFLGVSADNLNDLEHLAQVWLDDALN